MKRIPMGYEARLKAASRRRKLVRIGKASIVGVVVLTAGLWGYVLLTG
ncbi:hypothetical protein [Parafrankia sp. BMG5.11]|nr:hypothetical protein [Parafrankia sp. BMG5.11]